MTAFIPPYVITNTNKSIHATPITPLNNVTTKIQYQIKPHRFVMVSLDSGRSWFRATVGSKCCFNELTL
jgi:hypothetical protein